jgi:thymidylate synthase
MNKLDKDYTNLLKDILENGIEKETRNGKVLSVFGRTIRFKFNGNNFPLLTTKKMPFKTIVTELLWFLRGDTNIKYLVDNNCHIWNGDALKAYHKHEMSEFKKLKEKYPNRLYKFALTGQEEFINKIKTDDEFAKKWGELGPVYGKQWRKVKNIKPHKYLHGVYDETQIDQIQNLINELKTNPDSRRLMVNAWNVGELDQMTLPPCHFSFQVYTRELSHDERFEIYKNSNIGGRVLQNHITAINFKQFHFDEANIPTRAISLMWNQRSVDTFLGLPFNIASYGLLLEIIAKSVNMIPDELIGNLGDVHLYSNHIEQAKEQIGREYTLSERVRLAEEINGNLKHQTSIGMSYIDDTLKIPKRTREPFPLPKLVFMKTDEFFKELGNDLSLIGHLDNDDFKIEGYQSHPTIKAPLSN